MLSRIFRTYRPQEGFADSAKLLMLTTIEIPLQGIQNQLRRDAAAFPTT